MLISKAQVETYKSWDPREGKERDHAVSQWTHRGLSVSDYSPTAALT